MLLVRKFYAMHLKTFLKILLTGVVLYGLNLALPHVMNSYWVQILCTIGINIILAVSLNLINGITGQFSLGHAGFMAIGAYLCAAITFYGHAAALQNFSFLPLSITENLFFFFALILGGLGAALGGLLVGIPTLRLRGDYLAIATLGFGEIVRVVVLNLDAVGGATGFTGISEYSNFFWISLVGVATTAAISNLVKSTRGKALLAIREDEIAAESIGIDTSRYKILAFTLGAFFAGLAGGLFAHLMTYLHTNSFSFLKSIEIVVMIVLGGLGSITGSILAAVALTILSELLRAVGEWRMIIYALLLIVLMIIRPQGIMGMKEWGRLKR